MNPLSAVYGQVARLRRQWYEQPDRRQQLDIPVVSVGNLVVGGSGKTPVVAMLAALLQDAGFTPAVLSRGYKRRQQSSDVVVVSDGRSVLVDVHASGDEPQLLARRLRGVPVVVGANRYDAGVVARDRLGADVLILDDGFQHLRLARTVDLLLLSEDDLAEQVLPVGRLRESLDAARHADAVLVPEGTREPAQLARRLGVDQAFAVHAIYRPLRRAVPYGEDMSQPPRRVVVLAGIARPQRFVDAVRQLGYSVEQQILFHDHHWFTAADLQRVRQAARDAGADAVVTTEKDAVRLGREADGDVPIVFLPMDVQLDPADAFRTWLLARLRSARVS